MMAARKKNAVVEPTETTEQTAATEPVEATEQAVAVEPIETNDQAARVEPVEATGQTATVEPVEAAAQVTETKPAKGIRQATEYPFNRTLKFGADGEDVKALQKALSSAGLTVKVSGMYDLRTVRAVQQLQRQKRLPETGIVGKHDYPMLLGKS